MGTVGEHLELCFSHLEIGVFNASPLLLWELGRLSPKHQFMGKLIFFLPRRAAAVSHRALPQPVSISNSTRPSGTFTERMQAADWAGMCADACWYLLSRCVKQRSYSPYSSGWVNTPSFLSRPEFGSPFLVGAASECQLQGWLSCYHQALQEASELPASPSSKALPPLPGPEALGE